MAAPGGGVTFQDLAAYNGIDVRLFRRELNRWLTDEIMRDRSMSQDFRIAMASLCRSRLEPDETDMGVAAPVLEWLRGELRAIGALRQTYITAKITRHNGRAMLRSLCRWLRLCGRAGDFASPSIFVRSYARRLLSPRGCATPRRR